MIVINNDNDISAVLLTQLRCSPYRLRSSSNHMICVTLIMECLQVRVISWPWIASVGDDTISGSPGVGRGLFGGRGGGGGSGHAKC